MSVPTKYLTFQNGEKMPKIGLGLWKGGDAGDLEIAIDHALDAGYRHFDTAFLYETEDVLGKSIKKWIDAGKGKREDLFIVTKLPWNAMEPRLVERFVKLSLKNLKLSYIDLYLIHWPCAVKYLSDLEFNPEDTNGDLIMDPTTDLEAIWKEMEKQVDAKLIKSIGVSNFTISQTERILKIARIPPVNNQVEVHSYFQNKELVNFSKKHNITICAYSPLGGPWRKTFPGLEDNNPTAVNLLEDPIVIEIAAKHKKTASQILLRHLLELGVAVIPKSSNPERLKQNIDLFSFKLDSGDLKKLENLDQGEDGRANYPWKNIQNHPEAPFKSAKSSYVK